MTAITKIIPLLAVNTHISRECEHARLIDGAIESQINHDGDVVDTVMVPAAASTPVVSAGVVTGIPEPQDGVKYLVNAVVFNASDRSDLCVYDRATAVANKAPMPGVAYQRSLVFSK